MWLYELGEAYSADLECDSWYQAENNNKGAYVSQQWWNPFDNVQALSRR
jgi:hypothetical protein